MANYYCNFSWKTGRKLFKINKNVLKDKQREVTSVSE